MKELIRQIAALAVVLLLICVGNRLASGNAYSAYVPAGSVRVHPAEPGLLRLEEAPAGPDQARVSVVPRRVGTTDIFVYEDGRRLERHELRVGPMLTVYDVTTGGFTGDGVVMISITVFFLAVAAIMLRYTLKVRPPEF